MIKVITFCLILFTSNSFAQNSSNINKNTNLEIANQIINPFLIGEYNLKVYGFNVYNIKLFSENNKFSYHHKFAIEINYKMNFTKKELVKKTIEEIARIQKISNNDQLKNFEDQFMKIFLDVKKGDCKVAIFIPKKGVDLYFNHQLVGSISNLTLAKYFTDIWLSKNSSYPQMTSTILGENNDQ